MIGKHALKAGIVALFVLALSFAAHPAIADNNDSAQVLQVTSDFYKDYLKTYDFNNDDYPELIPYLAARSDIDPKFVEKLDKLIAEARANDSDFDGLDYDPIIMGQEFPDKMTYNVPVINGTTAEIIANKFWGTNSTPLCIVLNKQDNAWRISEVIDMDHEDFQRNCGGMTVE